MSSSEAGAGLKNGGKRKLGMLQNLSPEERQKLRQAHQAAKADPAVQAAEASGDKKAMRKAMREVMSKNDPSIAPILEKVRNGSRKERGDKAGNSTTPKVGKGGSEVEQRLSYLAADERAKLIVAGRTAQVDPKVSAARQQWSAATDPAAKVKAAQAYRSNLRDAVLRNDPSLVPVIQKVQEHREAQIDEMGF